METSQNTSKIHMIIGILLLVVGVLVFLVFISLRSQGDAADSSATVSNSQPTINTFSISTTSGSGNFGSSGGGGSIQLDISEATTSMLYAYGTFTDLNGCSTVTSTSNVPGVISFLELGPTSTVANQCFYGKQDYESCYVSAAVGLAYPQSCTFSACDSLSDTTGSFECTFKMESYADATDIGGTGASSAQVWYAEVRINDNSATSNAATATSTLSFELATLNALNVSNSLDYGSVAVGATSSEATLRIINTGNNNALDFAFSGSNLTCTQGSIDTSRQRFSSTTGFTWGNWTSDSVSGIFRLLTSSSATNTYKGNLTKPTGTTTESATRTYWLLAVPTPSDATALRGTCTGQITVLATD